MTIFLINMFHYLGKKKEKYSGLQVAVDFVDQRSQTHANLCVGTPIIGDDNPLKKLPGLNNYLSLCVLFNRPAN